ncbi:DUF1580 domain-containing protein [Gemmata sp.]|uniref:DUF1580 domain-containing protein n=1 Tax=Gemmata sp. TaxID=1914242 RepID=UPI003F72A805
MTTATVEEFGVEVVLREVCAGDGLSLAQAAALIPAHRGNGTANPTSVMRWIVDGARDPNGDTVKLEAGRLGGRWLTSRQALARFMSRLTPTTSDSHEPNNDPPKSRSASTRQKAAEKACAALAAMGA